MVTALVKLGGHVTHPTPVNQFRRLEYDEVHDVFVKTSEWNNIVNGHNFDAENCMAAEGAVGIDADSNGAIHTSPAGIRNFQNDFSGGIGIDDVDVAWHNHFGHDMIRPDNTNWAETIHIVRSERRHCSVAIDYRLVPAQYRRQDAHNFDHAIGIDDERDSDGFILIYDSLGSMPFWAPQSAFKPAAERIAIRERGTSGRLFVGFGRNRPALGGPSPHYEATVTVATELWNPISKKWVFQDVAGPGDNRIKVGTKLEVRGAQSKVGPTKTSVYPVTAGPWSKLFAGYMVPVKHVKLGDIVS